MTPFLADLQATGPTLRPALHAGRARGDHQRLLLLALVEADPGIHLMRVTHLLSLHWNTCYHHARRLVADGRLIMRKVQGRLCLFDPKQGALESRIGPILLRDARVARLAAAILERPGSHQKQLARAIDVAPSVVHRHVVRLERAGLVQRVRRARAIAVYAGEGLGLALAAHGHVAAGGAMPGALLPA